MMIGFDLEPGGKLCGQMSDLRSVEPRNLIFSAEAAPCRDCALALMADPPFSVVRPTCIHNLFCRPPPHTLALLSQTDRLSSATHRTWRFDCLKPEYSWPWKT